MLSSSESRDRMGLFFGMWKLDFLLAPLSASACFLEFFAFEDLLDLPAKPTFKFCVFNMDKNFIFQRTEVKAVMIPLL